MSPESPLLTALWHEPAPRHFDQRVVWWVKLLAFAVMTIAAMLYLDVPVAHWAAEHPMPDLAYFPKLTAGAVEKTNRPGPIPPRGDNGRELLFLEQYGQFTCSVLAILLVATLDPKGRRRALAIAIACLATLAMTHLIKDLAGRSRPFVVDGSGTWQWRGPWQTSSAWGSFPSAHTTAAFALAAALAWFYPRGRWLFMSLALIVAAQRVLHTAHYLSDVIAGIAVGVLTARATLLGKLAGRVLALLPAGARVWFMREA